MEQSLVKPCATWPTLWTGTRGRPSTRSSLSWTAGRGRVKLIFNTSRSRNTFIFIGLKPNISLYICIYCNWNFFGVRNIFLLIVYAEFFKSSRLVLSSGRGRGIIGRTWTAKKIGASLTSSVGSVSFWSGSDPKNCLLFSIKKYNTILWFFCYFWAYNSCF